MRNKAVLLVFCLLVAASCGNGGGGDGKKAEFDSYEGAVRPLLEEEGDLRRASADSHEAAESLGRYEEFEELVRGTLVPGYARLSKRADEIRVAGGLVRIHGRLKDYLKAREDNYRVFLEWVGKAAEPAGRLNRGLEREAVARKKARGLLDRIREIANANPALMPVVTPLLQDDPVVAKNFFGVVEMFKVAQITAEELERNVVADRVEPYLDGLEAKLGELEVDEVTGEVVEAVKAYAASMREYLVVLKEFIAVYRQVTPFIQKELKPLLDRFNAGLGDTGRDLGAYLRKAWDYRAALD